MFTAQLLIALAIVLAATILNRMSGDDRWMRKRSPLDPATGLGPKWLRGRPLFYTAPILGGLAWLVHSWPIAGAFAVAYLLWRLPAWGHLFGLGRARPTDRPPSKLEQLCLDISFGDVHLAFMWRHLLMLIPGFALIGLLTGHEYALLLSTLPFALLIVGVYELSWRWRLDDEVIKRAELMTGALWGTLILLVDHV